MRRLLAPAGFVGVFALTSWAAGRWWAIGPMVLAPRADCHVWIDARFLGLLPGCGGVAGPPAGHCVGPTNRANRPCVL